MTSKMKVIAYFAHTGNIKELNMNNSWALKYLLVSNSKWKCWHLLVHSPIGDITRRFINKMISCLPCKISLTAAESVSSLALLSTVSSGLTLLPTLRLCSRQLLFLINGMTNSPAFSAFGLALVIKKKINKIVSF